MSEIGDEIKRALKRAKGKQLAKEAIREVVPQNPYHSDDAEKAYDTVIDMDKINGVMEGAVKELLSDLIGVYLLNKSKGFPQVDGTYCLHKHTWRLLQDLKNNEINSLDQESQALINLYARRLSHVIVSALLED